MRLKMMICLSFLLTQQVPSVKAAPPSSGSNVGMPYEAGFLTVLTFLTIYLIDYAIGKSADDKPADRK